MLKSNIFKKSKRQKCDVAHNVHRINYIERSKTVEKWSKNEKKKKHKIFQSTDEHRNWHLHDAAIYISSYNTHIIAPKHHQRF